MPGSDVDHLLNHRLPRLANGVVVHIHDVLLPDPYPVSWAWRGYNEQLLVAALLQGGSVEPLFASHYVVTRMAERLDASVIASTALDRRCARDELVAAQDRALTTEAL